jgi:hypothetical protein
VALPVAVELVVVEHPLACLAGGGGVDPQLVRDRLRRDRTGTEYAGVWVSDSPLMANVGAPGHWLITIELPAAVAWVLDREHEWVEEGKPYREWLVPADLLNAHGVIVEVERD